MRTPGKVYDGDGPARPALNAANASAFSLVAFTTFARPARALLSAFTIFRRLTSVAHCLSDQFAGRCFPRFFGASAAETGALRAVGFFGGMAAADLESRRNGGSVERK